MTKLDASWDPAGFKSRCEIPVRFKDLDPMGHVNNAVYLTYFEIGRTQYAHDLGMVSDGRPFNETFPFIMARIDCRFLSAARLAETLVVYVRTVRMGKKSFEFDYLITGKEDGRKVATGHSVQVFYDYKAGKSMAIPGEFREKVEVLEGWK